MCTYQNRPNMVCSLTKNRRIKVPASTWFYYIPKKIPRLRSIPRGMYTYRNRPRYLHKPIGMFLGLGSVLNIKMIKSRLIRGCFDEHGMYIDSVSLPPKIQLHW